MQALLLNLVPTYAQLAGLAALALVVVAYLAIGAAVGGRDRVAECDLVAGWAVASLGYTLLGTATGLDLAWVGYALFAAAVVCAAWAWRRDRSFAPPLWIKLAVVGLPLIFLVTAIAPSQWDEFSHWLPNARYLYDVGGFPGQGRPESISALPGYPYGLAVAMHMASLLAGFFTENAGALFNLSLLMALALMAVRFVRTGVAAAPGRPGWGMAALGLLAATALNPSFIAKIAFTAYADTATAVALGLAGALAVLGLEALAAGAPDRARRIAWQLGLVLAALVNTKQVDVVLAFSLIVGVIAAAWRDPKVGLRPLVPLALPTLALPAVMYVAWQIYVGVEIPGGELALRPIATWHFALIPDILERMAYVASRKGGYFGLMLAVLGVACWAARRVTTPLDRLAVVTAVVFLGYNAFLLLTYLAFFGAQEAIDVVSFWRYNMHLGGLAVLCGALGGAVLWRRWVGARPRLASGLGWAAIAVMVALPVGDSHRLRFDVRAPKQYVKAVAHRVGNLLKPDDRVVVIDIPSDGTYANIFRYELHDAAMFAGWILGPRTPAQIRKALDSRHANYVWVHTPSPEAAAALGVRLAPRASHLFARTGDGWREIASWPYPGYDRPSDVAD